MNERKPTKRAKGQGRFRFPPRSVSSKASAERGSNRRRSSSGRTSVPHSTRPEVSGVCHVVLRVRRGLPWLRTPKTYRVLERALRAGKEKPGFALVHYSVQGDHLHLLVETSCKRRLARGMQGLVIRIAKALNRFWRGRLGSVFAQRYFSRALEGFRELRNALAYVVNNARKHGVWTSPTRTDPYSSGRWHRGWSRVESIRRPLRSPPVVPAKHTYLTMPWSLELTFVPGRNGWRDAVADGAFQLA